MPELKILPLLDSERLPKCRFFIRSLKVDGVETFIEKWFKNRNDFFDYLNKNIRGNEPFTGNFTIGKDSAFHFVTSQSINEIEVMAMLGNKNMTLIIGDADPLPFPSGYLTPTAIDGNKFTVLELEGYEVLNVIVQAKNPLVKGQWKQENTQLTLSPGYRVENTFIELLIQQIAPDKGKTGTPTIEETINGNSVHFDFSGETGSKYILKKGDTPDENDAEALFLPTEQAYYTFTYEGTEPAYFFLYAIAGNKTISNPATYQLTRTVNGFSWGNWTA